MTPLTDLGEGRGRDVLQSVCHHFAHHFLTKLGVWRCVTRSRCRVRHVPPHAVNWLRPPAPAGHTLAVQGATAGKPLPESHCRKARLGVRNWLWRLTCSEKEQPTSVYQQPCSRCSVAIPCRADLPLSQRTQEKPVPLLVLGWFPCFVGGGGGSFFGGVCFGYVPSTAPDQGERIKCSVYH